MMRPYSHFSQSYTFLPSLCGPLRWIYVLSNYFYVLDEKYLLRNHLQIKLESLCPLRLLSVITYSHSLRQNC